MLFIVRVIAVVLIGIMISLIGIVFCLFNPRNPKNVARFAHLYSYWLTPLLGVKVITRSSPAATQVDNCIFIANHQSNYDVLIAGRTVKPGTVTVGKKSLAWIPFFGQLYYLTGTILIDRENKAKARDTIAQVAREIKQKHLSVWMFPEGTRNHGRGLLPFKTGAFRAAVEAQVPLVPICISDVTDIRLNRWNNGYVVIEILDPIDTAGLNRNQVRELMEQSYALMSAKIVDVNQQAKALNQQTSN